MGDDLLACDAHGAARRVVEPGDHVEQGRLAASGGAENCDELALGDAQADVLKREHTPLALRELLRDAFDLDHACASSVRQCSTTRPAQTMIRSERKPSSPTENIVATQMSIRPT